MKGIVSRSDVVKTREQFSSDSETIAAFNWIHVMQVSHMAGNRHALQDSGAQIVQCV